MMKFTYIGIFLLLLSSCVEFKQLSLYEGVEPAPVLETPESINQIVEPEIYSDNPSDMWGIEETICKNAELTYDDVYQGDQAVKITWNRSVEGCEFAGIGIGWDGYAGKDLTRVMDHAAIRFYVKAQKERMFGLPIVLTLEDYTGGMGFAYTDNRYFERTFIDTNWQKVEVPLSAFDLETENLDVTNIKQLQLELQQSGSIVLDEIELVFYTPQEVEPWMEEEKLPDPLDLPVTIFDDAFINNHGWGMMTGNCRDIKITSGTVYQGSSAISAKWEDGEDCDVMMIAASWNKWHPVDFTRRSMDDFAFEFYIYNREKPTSDLNLYIGLMDYNRNMARTQVTAEYADIDLFNASWTRVLVPLAELEGSAIDFSNIKQMFFQLEKTGDLLIDEVKLVRRMEN
jgi:hypothetical protein